MTALFSVIPVTLFNPLASPGALVYADVLLALLAGAQRHHLPLSRDLALSIVTERINRPAALALTADAVEGSEPLTDNPAQDAADVVQTQASAVLRYLVRCGWLRAETQSDFTQAFIIPDYAFRLLRAFQEIATDEPPPLRGLICSIHDLLQAAIRDGNADVRLPEAHRQTLHLLNGLKELQHNIGLHIERMLRQRKTSEALEQLFQSYHTEVVDRAYHQLRTTDHVSRYRPGVVAATVQLERHERVEMAARRIYERGEERTVEDAAQKLIEQLRAVRENFEALDRLLQAIDVRHSQFVDSAVRAIELQLAASTSTSGQLHAILSLLLNEEKSVDDDPLNCTMHSLLNLFEVGFIDQNSLMTPARAPIPFEPEVANLPALSLDEVETERLKTLEHLLRAWGRARVRRYALELLSERDSLMSDEIPLSGPEDLPFVIYLRAYGDGSLGYFADDIEDGAWTERAGIGFRAFTLRKSK